MAVYGTAVPVVRHVWCAQCTACHFEAQGLRLGMASPCGPVHTSLTAACLQLTLALCTTCPPLIQTSWASETGVQMRSPHMSSTGLLSAGALPGGHSRGAEDALPGGRRHGAIPADARAATGGGQGVKRVLVGPTRVDTPEPGTLHILQLTDNKAVCSIGIRAFLVVPPVVHCR